jgi:uncharacterized membrane protein
VREHRDLEAATLGALIGALGALLVPVEVVRLLFAAPLALFLPGYALACAALLDRRLETPQVLCLSVGLSLAVLAIAELGLNYLGGLRAGPWALLLLLLVIALARLAAIRRPAAARHVHRPPRFKRPPALAVGLALGGILALSAAVAVAFVPVSAKHAVGYSELWLKPAHNGGRGGVSVGVGNQEHDRTAYGLIARFGGGEGTLVIRRFGLEPGQRRTFHLAPRSIPSRSVRVAVTLYRKAHPNVPYRRVFGWTVPPSSAR